MKREPVIIAGIRCLRADPIHAGMSADEKYDVMLEDGRRCLLRISQSSQLERKKTEYGMMETAYRHGIAVPRPYAFGEYDENSVFQLMQWLDGQTLEDEISMFNEREKYFWGERAGVLLQKIHSIPITIGIASWKERFRKKIEVRLDEIEGQMEIPECISVLRRYMIEEIDLLNKCGQCFNHGDFYPGNLIHMTDGRLAVIDFNAYGGGYGDPAFETASILLDRKIDEEFKKGFKAGYYGMQENRYVEALLRYYQAYILLAELCEAEENDQPDILLRMSSMAKEISGGAEYRLNKDHLK